MHNGQSLIDLIPWSVVIPWVIAQGIPYLGALATKAPSWSTAAVNALLSIITSFATEYVAKGSDFDWKTAVVNSFITFAWAAFHHSKWLKDTPHEDLLHYQFGNKPAIPPAPRAVAA
jgi:hypothetical protein